jgi:hypothetical protein
MASRSSRVLILLVLNGLLQILNSLLGNMHIINTLIQCCLSDYDHE